MRTGAQRALCVGFLALAFASGSASGCGPSTGDYDDDDDDNINGGDDDDDDDDNGPQEFVDAHPREACNKMDILFVIDDSGSMEEEQQNLAANFQVFADLINAYETSSGATLDYRVALTTTGRTITTTVEQLQIPGFPTFPPVTLEEVGQNGAFLDDCGMPRRWLERTDSDVAGKLSCAANVGISGPGIEMPLYAMEMAFGARVADGTNANFLRDDALLAVVMLTDENDCSRTDDNITLGFGEDPCATNNPALLAPGHFVEMLDQLKGERGRWAAAVIAGPGPGQCTSDFGDAAEATRLKEFVAGAGASNAVFSSICDADLASSLHEALGLFQAVCESFPPIE